MLQTKGMAEEADDERLSIQLDKTLRDLCELKRALEQEEEREKERRRLNAQADVAEKSEKGPSSINIEKIQAQTVGISCFHSLSTLDVWLLSHISWTL